MRYLLRMELTFSTLRGCKPETLINEITVLYHCMHRQIVRHLINGILAERYVRVGSEEHEIQQALCERAKSAGHPCVYMNVIIEKQMRQRPLCGEVRQVLRLMNTYVKGGNLEFLKRVDGMIPDETKLRNDQAYRMASDVTSGVSRTINRTRERQTPSSASFSMRRPLSRTVSRVFLYLQSQSFGIF